MIPASIEPRPWSPGRWGVAVALVFALQIGLMVWLEDRTPAKPRTARAAPRVRLNSGKPAAWLALEDPTLFVLPHRQGFSGQAWLMIPSQEFRPVDWSEEPGWLPLAAQEFGASFEHFVQTNPPPAFPTLVMPEPELIVPETLSTAPVFARSRVRVEGELALRRLLPMAEPRAWTNTDLLTNSVVQLLVDAQGNTFSAVLLPPGSGLTNADHEALELARKARFTPESPALSPARNASARLTIGTMIFEWQTMLVAATNTSAGNL